MSSKSETRTGSQKVNINLTNAIGVPLKVIGTGIGIAAAGALAGYGGGALNEPPTQRIEQVQVADAETKAALKEILETIQDTREKVVGNTGKIEAVAETQKEIKRRVDKNEVDIERVERRGGE